MPYRRRQLVAAALTANALRPLGGRFASVPAFFAGWLASELAPQLLAATLVDTAAELTVRRSRTGHPSREGLALAAITAGGLGYLIVNANRAATHVESTLRDGLGDDYLEALEEPPTSEELKTRVRELARPFKMAKPDVEVIRDINYTVGREAGPARHLPSRRASTSENAPVLVQVHGGGWTIGTKEQQGLLLMNRMAQRGWICVAMNYRLAPKHPFPAQIIDVKKAIAWTRENIAAYGGDPSYLVVTGGSAGGHLAALAALTPGEPEYQPGFEDADTSVAGCVPFYGVYDLAGLTGEKHAIGDARLLPRPARVQEEPGQAPRRLRQGVAAGAASPPTRRTSSCCTARYDSLVDVRQARTFVDKLKAESKATVTYAEFPGDPARLRGVRLDPQPPRDQGRRAVAAAPPHRVPLPAGRAGLSRGVARGSARPRRCAAPAWCRRRWTGTGSGAARASRRGTGRRR